MSKKRVSKSKETEVEGEPLSSSRARSHKSYPLLAILLLTASVLCFVSLLDYNQLQSPEHTSDPRGLNSVGPDGQEVTSQGGNLVGRFGSFLGFWGFRYLGLGAWILPVVMLRVSYLCLNRKSRNALWTSGVALGLAMLAVSCLGDMFREGWLADTYLSDAEGYGIERSDYAYNTYSAGHGGLVGTFFYEGAMKRALGPFGSGLIFWVVAVGGLLIGLLNHPYDSGVKAVRGLGAALQGLGLSGQKWLADLKERQANRKVQQEDDEVAKALRDDPKTKRKKKKPAPKKKDEDELPDLDEDEAAAEETPKKAGKKKSTKKSLGTLEISSTDVEEEEAAKKAAEQEAEKEPAPAKKVAEEAPEEEEEAPTPVAKKAAKKKGELKIIQGEVVEKAAPKLPTRQGDYEFPTLDLLQEPPKDDPSHNENYQETADALIETLKQFKVEVEPDSVHSGPVITRYEVVPAPGVRVNKIENLDKDLALGLKAEAVRILAPVPGKGTVGIEVPNKISVPVCMRDIVESKAWDDSKAEIPIVLGKEVTGRPVVVDLTKMPHMLIAGSTGAGKTVCINAIIASLLYKASPDDLRFIMVDPKVVEMQVYNDLPHMLIPVVTQPKKVPGALKWLIGEMERRFQIFAEAGVRNIASFNAKLIKNKEEKKEAEARAREAEAALSPEERAELSNLEVPRDANVDLPDKKLPYIVCIIDELADLMMVAPADIETGIARITQLARAAGIHMILATQRPSTNVITGVIKANLPCRISFRVASQIDSRTILDGKGAESLIGKGDMLFTPPGSPNLLRAQGAFVSDEEINGIVEYLKRNGPPMYAEEVQAQIEAEGEEGEGGVPGEDGAEYEDEMIPAAIQVIKTSKRASTSMLQRRLKIGYNRAARIMDLLEEEGVVGPENGSSPREILIDVDG